MDNVWSGFQYVNPIYEPANLNELSLCSFSGCLNSTIGNNAGKERQPVKPIEGNAKEMPGVTERQ